MNIFKKLFRPTPPTEYIELKATKHCSRCKKTMETSAFNKCRRTLDGLQYWCRTCQSNFEKQSAEKPKKNAKKMVKLPATNFEKPFLQLNVGGDCQGSKVAYGTAIPANGCRFFNA